MEDPTQNRSSEMTSRIKAWAKLDRSSEEIAAALGILVNTVEQIVSGKQDRICSACNGRGPMYLEPWCPWCWGLGAYN